MKILIITYSREVNPGTFLQAYGVQYFFKQLYPNARIDLIKHKRLYGNFSTNIKLVDQSKKGFPFLKGKLAAIPRRLKYEYAYKRCFNLTKREFDFFNYDQNDFQRFADGYDLIVVGSDTILVNLKKNGKYGLMWLLGVKTVKILFSASATPAKYDLSGEDEKKLYDSFKSFSLLSVRDRVTYDLLANKLHLGERVDIQPDPTYLIPENIFTFPYWMRLKFAWIRKKRKICLVNFGDGFVYKKDITKFLRLSGYYTISTLYNEWADSNLMTFSPFEWATMFQYVDLTVTERFHDSVFTLRNNKPVIAVDWDSRRYSVRGFSKTKDLFYNYGIQNMHNIILSKDDIIHVYQKIKIIHNDFDAEQQIKQQNLNIQSELNELLKYVKEKLKK